MKLSKMNIINMKTARTGIQKSFDEAKENGTSIRVVTNNLIHQIMADYGAASHKTSMENVSLSEIIRDYKRDVEEKRVPQVSEEWLKNSIKEQKDAKVYNVMDRNVGLVSVYLAIKDQLANRKRFDWLFHPIRTYRENKAFEQVTDTFKQFDINLGYVLNLKEILNSEDNNMEVEVADDNTEISYTKELTERDRISLDSSELEEASVDSETSEIENNLVIETEEPELDDSMLSI